MLAPSSLSTLSLSHPFGPVSCACCSCVRIHPKAADEEHDEVCPKALRKCVNVCNRSHVMPTDELLAHIHAERARDGINLALALHFLKGCPPMPRPPKAPELAVADQSAAAGDRSNLKAMAISASSSNANVRASRASGSNSASQPGRGGGSRRRSAQGGERAVAAEAQPASAPAPVAPERRSARSGPPRASKRRRRGSSDDDTFQDEEPAHSDDSDAGEETSNRRATPPNTRARNSSSHTRSQTTRQEGARENAARSADSDSSEQESDDDSDYE